ncbi:hypothetical protein BN7_3838 [Wickerhamomyces ciferrii]|uniref:Uncharacterized protein n=1 Tax=Wickerhamomyces ciferrii (strain ATCC 14091 / BCRC 22168 / CBS 111 / JCM 3599 / NBRC 0793 / NRRL Y-1031 F-60-10) TaxID=1206466 RepID=K0KQ53_WICCF|nr:uncharacterized protein BN7_3838 [Wickerhamomyces ciferrii]CCH44277.1 hypothetical protein BN7_3838 [Wickerhamomyces ciferrii]
MPVQPVPHRRTSEELISKGSNNSSDFLGIEEPPAPCETPEPSNWFPLKRRSSSNYKTALLGDKLQNVGFSDLNKTHGKDSTFEEDPLSSSSITTSKPQKIDITNTSNDPQLYQPQDEGQWSPEGIKRNLQRRSTGIGEELSQVKTNDSQSSTSNGGEFNVQYRGSISYPPQSTQKENAPNSKFHNIPRSYHSNQQSPAELDEHHKNDYFPRSFEYADFKRRMSRD